MTDDTAWAGSRGVSLTVQRGMTTTTGSDLFLLDPHDQDLLFRTARTPRELADEPVDDAVVAAVHDLVRWGPTALNSSPLRLLLVRTPQARERLASHVAEANRERVLAAPLTLVVAADADFHEHLPVLAPHMAGAAERFAADPAGRERVARDNAWLQAGYLLVGLRAAGLDVGPMSGMDAAGIDADLLAGTSWRSLMVVNVGRPTGAEHPFPRAPRLTWEQTATVL